MYFGKLEKKSEPRMGMSNMLWWFETMMYDVHGSTSGERSTARRGAQMPEGGTRAHRSGPATYPRGRRAEKGGVRCGAAEEANTRTETGGESDKDSTERAGAHSG